METCIYCEGRNEIDVQTEKGWRTIKCNHEIDSFFLISKRDTAKVIADSAYQKYLDIGKALYEAEEV